GHRSDPHGLDRGARHPVRRVRAAAPGHRPARAALAPTVSCHGSAGALRAGRGGRTALPGALPHPGVRHRGASRKRSTDVIRGM
ncbi:MAG: hypothetical protein AVDCRST_MAG66-1097, partial [uncultured Pseudonocardia sp.]